MAAILTENEAVRLRTALAAAEHLAADRLTLLRGQAAELIVVRQTLAAMTRERNRMRREHDVAFEANKREGITVREACRRRLALGCADAQCLEHALTMTESERDEAKRERDAAGPRRGWYCSQCHRGVPPFEVTNAETHTECGRMIEDDMPSQPGRRR